MSNNENEKPASGTQSPEKHRQSIEQFGREAYGQTAGWNPAWRAQVQKNLQINPAGYPPAKEGK